MISAIRIHLVVLALMVTGSAASAQTPGSAERGAEIASRWCTECHATAAVRRAADVGPTFPQIARTRSPDYIRGFLANPHLRGLMPPFDLTTAHVEDIVAYLRTLQ
jgi:mono/diheme cytochrome c family protein